MSENFEQLLQRAAQTWGLSAPIPDTDGCYRLVVDDRFEIKIFQTGNQVILEGAPGRLPDDDRQDTERLGEILRGCLAEMAAHEEVLTLAPEGPELLLFRRLHAPGLTFDALERALESFANRLERWTAELTHNPSRTAAMPAAHFVFP